MWHILLLSIVIFMVTTFLNLLTERLQSLCCKIRSAYSYPYSIHLTNNYFGPSNIFSFIFLFFYLPRTREEYQDTFGAKIAIYLCWYFLLSTFLDNTDYIE